MQIIRVQKTDEGVYQCVVTNEIGSVTTSALLTVKNLAPKFHANIFPAKVFVIEDAKLQLPCFYHASPRGQSFWRRISSKSKHSTNNNFSSTILTLEDESSDIAILRLDNVQLTDAGFYECVASNSEGHASSIVQIVVLRKLN